MQLDNDNIQKYCIEDWNDKWNWYKMSKDIPIKCTVLFQMYKKKFPFVKSLSFDITIDKTRKEKRVDLKDFKVEWK